MDIIHKNIKSKTIRYSGRSSDIILPSFFYECKSNCMYCYVKRHNKKNIEVSDNYKEILSLLDNYDYSYIKKPNQIDEKFITCDIGCNNDISLDYIYAPKNVEYIIDYFKNSNEYKGTFATKSVNKKLMKVKSDSKTRIRFSLMPQYMSSIVEKKTSPIINRIKAINEFIENGWEVHINFSPVILYKDWLQDYISLFKLVDNTVSNDYKEIVKSEVIFLTHEENLHQRNLDLNFEGERFLWAPNIQEQKQSQFGGINVRYEHKLKKKYEDLFIKTHNDIIGWNKIRYIF